MVGVDQFVADRRDVGEDAEPAEGVDLLEGLDRRFRNRLAADAVVTVAARDEIAVDAVGGAVHLVGDVGLIACETVRRDVAGVIDGDAPRRLALVHQVVGDFRLAVDHDALVGQAEEVDPVVLAVEGQQDALVRQAFRVHPTAGSGAVQKTHHPFLEHAGAYAAKNVVFAHPVYHYVVDAGVGEQLSEQQARRPGADDGDLGAHVMDPP